MSRKVSIIITIIVVNLIVLGGASVFIAWYSDQIVFPSFTVEQGAVDDYNFTSRDHLNAKFIFVVHSLNNDPKYDVTYNKVVVSVYHLSGYSLTYESERPYTVHHGNSSFFTARPVARDVVVSDGDVAAEIRNETLAGYLELEVRVRVEVKYQVKGWKHKSYLFKGVCSPVVLDFTTWKTFNKTSCNVDSFQT